ncbi:MAG TPA: TetR/AcrR family transcriptional regulator [Solirubrobacterales bacterium]|nr:TetR/AcrR family transcriptional regulator [Solirubrobacterales bacterium]
MVGPPERPALRARWERRRRAIVATAARLFAERGYQATSITDLTEATGLAAGGLYHYFEGKDDLLTAICEELLEPLLERAHEVERESLGARDALAEVMTIWLEHVAAHRHHLIVFSQERHAIERQARWRHLRAQRKEFETILAGILERGEADGSILFEDRRLALLALLGMVNYTPVWLRPRGRLDAAEIAEGYLRILLGEAGGGSQASA